MKRSHQVSKTDWRLARFASGRSRSLALLLASALLGWEISCHLLDLRPNLIPTPSRVVLEMWQQAPTLLSHSIFTFSSILGALLSAIVLGVPLGLLVGASSKSYRRAKALLSILLRMPLVALAPLVVVWFGFGVIPNLLVPFMISLALVMASVAEGRRCLPPELISFLDTTGASRTSRVLKVHVPATLPFLMAGLRAATSWVIAAALVVELLGSEHGLGFLLMGATAKFDTPLIFAVVAVLTAMGALVYLSVSIAESLLIPWHREIQKSELISWSFIP